jgi:hypothetical protein
MSFVEFTEVLGNLGEFLGSLAVFATLIYLALQIRQSKELLERNEKIALSQVHQARADSRISISLSQVDPSYPEKLIGLWGKRELPEGLTTRELHIARNFMNANVVAIDNALYQSELGLLDAELITAAQDTIVANFDLWTALEIMMSARIVRSYNQNVKSAGQSDA